MKFTAIALLLSFSVIASRVEGDSELAVALPKMVGKSQEELKKSYADVLAGFGGSENLVLAKPTPWHVWSFKNANKEDRYVLFSGQHIFMIPGTSSASVRLFTADAKELGSWSFSTGWRIDLFGAKLKYNASLKAPVIEINTAPVINGRDVAAQYFAFCGDELHFIRLENRAGEILENNYHYPNHTLGGDAGINTKDQWLRALKSDSPVNQLKALTYLGGSHMDPEKPEEDVSTQTVEEAKLVLSLRGDAAVRKLIAKHRKSEVKWVQEAAKLANEATAK